MFQVKFMKDLNRKLFQNKHPHVNDAVIFLIIKDAQRHLQEDDSECYKISQCLLRMQHLLCSLAVKP